MPADAPTISALLAQRATEQPHDLAFSFRGHQLTYGDLQNDTDRLAGMLAHRGVRAGHRVALILPAGLDLVSLFFAAQRLNAVPCIFDPHVPEATTDRRVAAIRAHLVLRELPDGLTSPLPPIPSDHNAPAFLQATSGTSGEPLAAVTLQRNVFASLRASRDLIDPGAADVLVGWVPPWHDLGLLRFLLAPLFFARPCHLIPPAIRTIPEWLETISAVRGTITGAPDFAWRLASRLVSANAVNLTSLRIGTNGGEPVRASTIAVFEERFGVPGVVRPGYGLAEATLGVSSARIGAPMRVDVRGNVACGPPLSGVQVRLSDGEILVQSPGVFAGYFDAETPTSEVLREGWLHTGDAGALDSDGHLYVIGRRRALIKRGGATLAPREFEEAAHTVPGVRLAAAVGVPSELTEQIFVVVEVEDGTTGVERLVSAAVEGAVGFAPDRVVVQPPRTIPRTGNGKIRHAVLRDQLTPSNLRTSPSESSDGEAVR